MDGRYEDCGSCLIFCSSLTGGKYEFASHRCFAIYRFNGAAPVTYRSIHPMIQITGLNGGKLMDQACLESFQVLPDAVKMSCIDTCRIYNQSRDRCPLRNRSAAWNHRPVQYVIERLYGVVVQHLPPRGVRVGFKICHAHAD